MTVIALVAAGIAAAAHVGFWAMETLLWRSPKVHRLFGAATPEEAETMAPIMFNLGYYNLFVGLGAAAGAWLWWSGEPEALLAFTLAFMIAAAIVLLATSLRMWRGAVVQGLAPAVGLVALALS